MNDANKNKRLSVVKMAGNALLLQIICLFVAFLGIISKDSASIQQFWLLSRYCLIIGAICYFCMICFGLFLRRAFFVHLFCSMSVFLWITPLMLAGFELSGKNIPLLFLIAFLCLINIIVSYKSTLSKVVSKDIPVEKSGRLDVKNGTWDLDKKMIIDESSSVSESIVKILIPLGAVLGTFLYRNFPGQENLLATLYNFVIAVAISGLIGIHIAISRYILLVEKKYNKHIQVF